MEAWRTKCIIWLRLKCLGFNDISNYDQLQVSYVFKYFCLYTAVSWWLVHPHMWTQMAWQGNTNSALQPTLTTLGSGQIWDINKRECPSGSGQALLSRTRVRFQTEILYDRLLYESICLPPPIIPCEIFTHTTTPTVLQPPSFVKNLRVTKYSNWNHVPQRFCHVPFFSTDFMSVPCTVNALKHFDITCLVQRPLRIWIMDSQYAENSCQPARKEMFKRVEHLLWHREKKTTYS